MNKILVSILLMSIALPTLAEDKSPWWKIWQDTEETVTTAAENGLFTKEERSILDDYLNKRNVNNDDDAQKTSDYKDKKHKKDKKQKSLPPGLQKKVERGGQLPPGWQKKVARGEVLEEDIYLASKNLPQDIIDILPTEPEGTTIRQIDDRIVRVMDATGVILDVLAGK